MFDFFLFNHVAMLRKNFGFGISVRHINLLFYFTVKICPVVGVDSHHVLQIEHFHFKQKKRPDCSERFF
jgi:hypothetical protein